MNTRKGFTLVELLVVIAILAILATVSVVGYTSFIEGADKQAAISEAEQAKSIIDGGLVLNDYVILVKEVKADATAGVAAQPGLYVDENGAVTTTAPTTGKGHDASADWELKGTLNGVNGVLYYTAPNGKIVNLDTLEIVASLPSEGDGK